MINDALNGKLPGTHLEFSELWQEKLIANYHAYNSIKRSLKKNNFTGNDIVQNSTEMIKAITAATRPITKNHARM